MNLHIYTVFDEKAAAYLTPFFAQNDEVAKRLFVDTCSTPDHAFNRNPEDYSLFSLGQFDDNKGTIKHTRPIFLTLGLNKNVSGFDRNIDTSVKKKELNNAR